MQVSLNRKKIENVPKENTIFLSILFYLDEDEIGGSSQTQNK